MDVQAPYKLLALVIVILGAFGVIIAAMFTNGDTTLVTSMVGLLGTSIGYLVGNGAAAKAGIVSVAPFQPSPPRQLDKLRDMIAEDIGVEVDPTTGKLRPLPEGRA